MSLTAVVAVDGETTADRHADFAATVDDSQRGSCGAVFMWSGLSSEMACREV